MCSHVGTPCYRRLSLLLPGFVLGVSTDFGNLQISGPLEFPFKWTDFKKTTAGFAENVLASFDEFPGHLYEREQF